MSHPQKSNARRVEKATGWGYQRSLSFVCEHVEAAKDDARELGITVKEALVLLAKESHRVESECTG